MKKYGFQITMIFVLFSGFLTAACRGTIYEEPAYPQITVSGSLPVIINGLAEIDGITHTSIGFYLHTDPSIGGFMPDGIPIQQDGSWTTTTRKYNKETPVKFSVLAKIQRFPEPTRVGFDLTINKPLGTETVYDGDKVINFPEHPSVEFTVVPVSGSLRIIRGEGPVGATITLYKKGLGGNFFYGDDICYSECPIFAEEESTRRWFTIMPAFTKFPETLLAWVHISGGRIQEKEITITEETDLLNIDLGDFVYTPRE
jgi:hypothetical protein